MDGRRVSGALGVLAALALSGCSGSHALSNRSLCTAWNAASPAQRRAYARTRRFGSGELQGRSNVAYISANCNLPTAQLLGQIQ